MDEIVYIAESCGINDRDRRKAPSFTSRSWVQKDLEMATKKMDWAEEFECGMAMFDDQHRLLMDLVNELSANLDAEESEAIENFQTVITRTFDAAAKHFADEERVMREGGVDMRHVGQHCTDHQRFIDQINNI